VPAWENICPDCFKQSDDDRDHSDWWVGAGMLPEDWRRDHPLQLAANDLAARIQEKLLGFTCAVLCGSGSVSGVIVHAHPDTPLEPGQIGVVRFAQPHFTRALSTGAALITQEGGSLCHLANVGRETGARIVRVSDALDRYPVGSRVTVDCNSGQVIELSPDLDIPEL